MYEIIFRNLEENLKRQIKKLVSVSELIDVVDACNSRPYNKFALETSVRGGLLII